MQHKLTRLTPRLNLTGRRRRRPSSSKPKQSTSEFPLQLAEIFFVALVVGLIAAHVVRLGSLPGIWSWPALLVILVAMPLADFVSGCIHWFFGTWGSEKTFFIGSRLIRPFRVHHAKPRDLLGSHFFTTNSDSSMANLPFLLAAFCVPLSWSAGPLVALFLVALGTSGLPTSQIHKWSHMSSPPRVVAWLQRRGLILGRQHHAVHHAAPHTIYYCITTGWCNPLLTKLDFFPRLERLITRVTGLQPRRGEEPEGEGHVAPAGH